MPTRLKPATRYVYVIGPATGLQKIGLATDPRARLAALQTASPAPLVLHVSVAVPFGEAHTVEAGAHRELAESRAAGEWFDVTPFTAVEAVRKAAQTHRIAEHQEAEPRPLPLFAFDHAPVIAASSLPRSVPRWAILGHVRRTIGWP